MAKPFSITFMKLPQGWRIERGDGWWWCNDAWRNDGDWQPFKHFTDAATAVRSLKLWVEPKGVL